MFVLSIFFILISSYLILSCITNNSAQKVRTGFIYFILIAFSQIVISFEILSLFKAISAKGILLFNIIFFIASILFFVLKKKELYKPTFDFYLIKQAIKRDKALMFLSICFVFFLCFQLIKIFFFPLETDDSLVYYLPRCTMWIQQGSISHFVTPDAREIIMPVNMEFLYTWFLLLKHNEIGIGIFSFIGFLFAVYVIYNFLKELNFTIKRRLWSIFVFSSFGLVIIEMVRPCSDLTLGALILASVYLFFKSIKTNDKTALYFSSLSFALAVGVKTTALITIPSIMIIFITLCLIHKRTIKNKFLSIKLFIFFFILNFLIFSSYNYILNFIQYNNPLSSQEQFLLNQFKDGIQGYIANIIKYFFAFFDMSGMPEFININGLIEYWQALVLKLFGVTVKDGTSPYFPYYFAFSNKMSLVQTSLGVMGLFVFLPSLIYSIKRVIKKKKSIKTSVMMLLAISFIINLVIFSRAMVFTGYNMRYILTFTVIASPVIAYSYSQKKLYKIFMCIIMFIYLIGFTHTKLIALLPENVQKKTVIEINENNDEKLIYDYFIKKGPVKIALVTNQGNNPIFYIEKLRLHKFCIEKILAENLEDYNLDNFDYIITSKTNTASNYIINFKVKIRYPELFITKCTYIDNKQRLLTDYTNENRPVFAECEIPFNYLKQKGFNIEENFQSDKYTILHKN